MNTNFQNKPKSLQKSSLVIRHFYQKSFSCAAHPLFFSRHPWTLSAAAKVWSEPLKRKIYIFTNWVYPQTIPFSSTLRSSGSDIPSPQGSTLLLDPMGGSSLKFKIFALFILVLYFNFLLPIGVQFVDFLCWKFPYFWRLGKIFLHIWHFWKLFIDRIYKFWYVMPASVTILLGMFRFRLYKKSLFSNS